MNRNPLVSVVLPAYNAQNTIGEAIQSIIDQTYSNWELLIINDGSKDDTKLSILSFKDPRIKYIENDENKKLIYTLNRGLSLSTGDYIARMDADDIAWPTRLEQQVAFMESHLDVIVCGSWVKTFGDGVKSREKKTFEFDAEIRENYLLTSPIAHPTAFIRRSCLVESGIQYDQEFKDAEDYKMWLDLMDYGKFHNIQECLLNYRISKTQVSQDNNPVQLESTRKCRDAYLMKYLDPLLYNFYKDNGVSVSLFKQYKKSQWNYGVLQAFYYSMNPYDLHVFLYYVYSRDFFHFGILDSIRLIKRFLGKRASIL